MNLFSAQTFLHSNFALLFENLQITVMRVLKETIPNQKNLKALKPHFPWNPSWTAF